MITILIGICAYIALHCAANQLNVLKYVTENKVTLALTAAVVTVVHLFGTTATGALIMALLMPFMASYSLPSLFAKLKDIMMRLLASKTQMPE